MTRLTLKQVAKAAEDEGLEIYPCSNYELPDGWDVDNWPNWTVQTIGNECVWKRTHFMTLGKALEHIESWSLISYHQEQAEWAKEWTKLKQGLT